MTAGGGAEHVDGGDDGQRRHARDEAPVEDDGDGAQRQAGIIDTRRVSRRR